MAPTQKRISQLLQSLQNGIYDKDAEMSLALLAALAGESILLLGPPGVAKSMIARRMKSAFHEARSFEYLMSRFSTPDEIFGPISIQKLKSSDTYERSTEGFLPCADVVFLDEIWKAGPAIQNALLTVMNEKLFRNGKLEMQVPMKLLIAASNELPAKDEGLEALWDRFLIRIVCAPIRQEEVFRKMLTDPLDTLAQVKSVEGSISSEEYAQWQAEANRVRIADEVMEAICHIRQLLHEVRPDGTELAHAVYVSDRRWKHIVRLLRMSAYVQGRSQVELADLIPIYHCLWNLPAEISAVRSIVMESMFAPMQQALDKMDRNVTADLNACRAAAAMRHSLRNNDHRDDSLAVIDRFFYGIEGHGTGHTCMYITEYKMLPGKDERPMKACIYTDPIVTQRRIARLILPEWDGSAPVADKEFVTLWRDNGLIYINGVAFHMKHSLQGNDEIRAHVGTGAAEGGKPVSSPHYEEEAEKICQLTEMVVKAIEQNIFAQPDDVEQAHRLMRQIYSHVATVRVGIRKLLYDEE